MSGPAIDAQPSSLGVPTLGALLGAELSKLSSRVSLRVSLTLLALVGVGVATVLFAGQTALNKATLDGGAVDGPPQATLALCLLSVRSVRSFFLVKSLIVWLVAESVAGEFVSRTLREDLVRPVHRSTVLAAKWLAVQSFVLLAALIPLLTGGLLGAAMFGGTDGLTEELQSWALTWLGDAGFAAAVTLAAVALRSVPGTLVGVILGWIAVYAVGLGLWMVEMIRPYLDQVLAQYNALAALTAVDAVIGLRPWLPSAAFALNGAVDESGALIWQSFVALGVYTALAYLAADRVFSRIDID